MSFLLNRPRGQLGEEEEKHRKTSVGKQINLNNQEQIPKSILSLIILNFSVCYSETFYIPKSLPFKDKKKILPYLGCLKTVGFFFVFCFVATMLQS